MSEAFAEILLRGDDTLAVTDEARSAIDEKRALEAGARATRTAPRGELASYLRMRAAMLAEDRTELSGLASSAPGRIAGLAAGWLADLEGRAPPGRERERGEDALSAALTVEALVLDARALLADGGPSPARELGLVREAAALASRVDQPHAQYLAYAALARTRRRTGRVPMATRLFASLLRSAPVGYHAWLAWDARLVGIREARSSAVDALEALLEAARRGERSAYDAARGVLLTAAGGSASRTSEAAALAAALDPLAPEQAMDLATRAFVRGERAELAGGLEGAAVDVSDPEAPLAFAIVDAQGVRRVLAGGLALAGPLRRLEISEHGGRTEAAIVTLAAAPRGMSEETFFRGVYGFTFKKAIHDGVLRVLLTRMRQALEPHASLVRDGDVLRLVAGTSPFALVDPRVSSRADNAVLRAIASERAVSAKEVAERTGLPLRTVQAELARLLDEGVCKKARDGRSTEYLVEDTVVREPSRVITARDLVR